MRDEVLRATTATCPLSTTTAAVPQNQQPWSKATLPHTDSALRESLRLNGFIERGVMKTVVAPQGVTIPDGSRISFGTKVGVSGYSIHHDEDIYVDARRYRAFRFVGGVMGEKGEGNGKARGLVATSETFLGFSHGRHAWYVPTYLPTVIPIFIITITPARLERALTIMTTYLYVAPAASSPLTS